MSETNPKKPFAQWIIAGLLSLVFLGAGLSKLTGQQLMVNNFAHWNFPSWFMYLTGGLEVLGAIGLWVRRARVYASLGLVGLMLGACATHLRAGELPMLVAPLVLGALAVGLTWLHRSEIPTWAGGGKSAPSH
jgi:putative oxidoreductase